ncbi:MAG: calcium/sodium antiporter [Gemmatimonadaceae bacterium]
MIVLISILLVIVGIALLAFGADVLVRGAVTIAKLARIPAAVIGLTIVSMGTSLPELTVSVAAALKGAPDLGVGNVVGSNIFNIGIVLGLTALMAPMRVHSSAVRLEWPFMFIASFQLLLLARDGVIDRLEGAFFVTGIVLFTAYVVRLGRSELGAEETADLRETVAARARPVAGEALGFALLLLAGGVSLLVLGGNVLLKGAIDLATAAGMSERVIGLTIVAAGTSAPEVATSLVAARRGQSEIALGNVIGSNIFNILGILGISALITPLAVSDAMLQGDFVWMLGLSLLLFPLMRSGSVVTRAEGGVLVAAYGTYLTLLLLNG